MIVVIAAATLIAGQPEPQTVAAWEAFLRTLERRIETEAQQPLGLASLPAQEREMLSRGEVLVHEPEPGGEAMPVPDGIVHHWRGRVFVPSVSLQRLIETVRDPSTHKQEDVLDARLLERKGDTDRVFLKLRRSVLVTAAYNTEHTVTYRTVGSGRVISRSVATKIAELDQVGTAEEREKPAGDDRGFLWRMHAYWRYDEAPDGVLVTLESATLSRAVPWALKPIASPIVNRVARESVVRTLSALRQRFAPGGSASIPPAGLELYRRSGTTTRPNSDVAKVPS